MKMQEINNVIENTTLEIKGKKEWYYLLEIRFNARMKDPNETVERVMETKNQMHELMDQITDLTKVRMEAVKAKIQLEKLNGKLSFV